jgi:hypothetical protein
VLLAGAILGPVQVAREPRLFAHDLHDLSELVARRVGRDADVVGYGVVSLRLDGRLWYADFRWLWEDELAAKHPSRLWRLRTAPLDATPLPPPPGPAGYQPFGEPTHLGRWPYRPDDRVVQVLLDELRPPPDPR